MCAGPSLLAGKAEYLPVVIAEKHEEHRYVQALWQAPWDKFASLAKQIIWPSPESVQQSIAKGKEGWKVRVICVVILS